MTVFVDGLRKNENKELCSSDYISHLFTDGDENELHSFAEKIGLKNKQWFDEREDRRHYDIDRDEFDLARQNGAKVKFHKHNQ
jgi:hypothetical protein